MIKKIYYMFILLFSIISVYLGFNITIIPDIALYLIILFYLINLILIAILLFRKKKILIIFGIILSIILIITNVGLIFAYNRINNFFDKITNTEYETNNYSVMVLKDSSFSKLDDITNIGLFYNEIDKNYKDAITELDDKKKIDKKEYDNVLMLVSDFLTKKIDAIFINENYIDIIDESELDFREKIKTIDTITINTEVKQNRQLLNDITKLNSFNIYISGIDTYGAINTVSRSDVNIIATVNIKDNKILLTNTPRDYYVQLHGTTGNKDKLTHAGVYGIDMSIKTLEDLYETNIDYYVRVNFNSLITLVDAIGGIDIYSDADFGWGYNHVNYGWNHFDGNQALNYSRQRKVYLEGDRHRGQNQQQVIEAIFKKVTESKDINTYLKLLDTLENSFQTNIDKKMINGFINLQVKNNYNWQFESIQVNGYDSGNYTYSYPGQYLYVMEPDYETLNNAKNKIKETLGNKESGN